MLLSTLVTPLTLLLAVAFAPQTHAAQSLKVLTGNAKAAASLQASPRPRAAAVVFTPGTYTLTNVATGAKMVYKPSGNHIYPAKVKKGVAFGIHQHPSGNSWVRLSYGAKNKCLSSAWGGSYNNAAVSYVCAVGKTAKQSTLEPTKQWWIIVPITKTAGTVSASTNRALLAAQAQSIATRNKKLAEQKAAFGNRLVKRAVVKRELEKRAVKKVSSGTFYIMATDHLIDMPTRALTGQVVKGRGILTTALTPYRKGNKAQQWRITKN